MLVYEGIKTDFLKSVEQDTIAYEIEERIYEKMNRHTVRNEFRSWENSMEYMYKVLNDKEIPDDAGIAIEYNIPQTSKRVDFLISGYDRKEKENLVIIELKQWDKLEAVEGQDALVETYTGNAIRQVVHPSYQAWSYAVLISDYNQSVQEKKILLKPCAYLHNYRRRNTDPIDAEQYSVYQEDAPVFTRGQVEQLRRFIKKSVVKGDKKEILYEVEHGKIRPSKSLQDSIAKMLQGNREFVMLDEQKVVYENILTASRKSMDDGVKRVIIVQGGPGTGKTVVAINLLAKLTNEDQFCQYVSKNSAPRNVYQKKLKGKLRKSSVDNMFKGSGIYTETGKNVVDTILVDEAHRLNEKSGMFHNMGENQINEIIHSSRCSVFFIDESQRVTISDIGSVAEIEKWASVEGAQVEKMELVSQFRCNGSDGYLAWLDNTLDIRETANWDMEDIDYDIRIMDSPNEMRNLILEKNKVSNNHARILAGYCWNWLKEGVNDSQVHDIKIGDFEISWNLKNTTTFAIDENSVNEAGCIHTSQGLEFAYVGVIIGDDLRYDNGKIVTDFTKRARTDQSLKGIKKMYKEDPKKAEKIADEIIKNTYRTLMTRGMKGCYVYCTDSKLAEYMKECLTTKRGK
ncbi:DNA/RNA helicase domain-containing protein [Faecalimonas sp.]